MHVLLSFEREGEDWMRNRDVIMHLRRDAGLNLYFRKLEKSDILIKRGDLSG